MLSLSEPTEIGAAANGARVFLAPMTPDAAESLGAAFSQIDPWVRYPLSDAGLGAHLGALEASAPRYVLRLGETPCGAVCLRLNWFSGPYVQFLGIVPEYQGRSLGSCVLTWLEAAASAQGVRNLWVAASDFNTGAIRLYERHGFVRVALVDNLVCDGRDEVLMRKKL